ncbi:hypothetical protein OHA84_02270 [Streptomyces sp. NBC_00513]|uniref:hypothetical protein n=1 Tax=unclassified Streptomyces TaxID=2593676 RepID=UPI000B28BCBD|nr:MULTISPECIES: hypothetical protein [unclassified Streptomyces]MCX5077626.1 hypothetical protein [Streptomyces sp. NBC_00424]WUD39403.1 hypothetical protein OHA84_02270 [Streptomyces sp. NBC_00513]
MNPILGDPLRGITPSLRTAGAAILALASSGVTAPAPTAITESHAALSASELTLLVQMADAYLQRRADAVTTGGSRIRFASAPVPMTAAAAENLAGDLTALQHTGRALEKVSGGIAARM